MATPQKKISELTTGTPAAADLVPFDNAAGTTTKKATVLALRGNLTPTVLETGFSLAGGTTPKTLTVDTDVTASALATQTYADAKIPKTDIDTDGAMAANSDTKIPSQQAVKEYAVPLSAIDTDEALAANSDTKVPSQQAVKAYADNLAFAGVPDASEATKGKAAIASAAEANAGTDDTKMMTAKKVKDSTAVPTGVATALGGKVATSGDETVNGVKTFGSIPVLPASDPITANQAVRKSYADSLVVKNQIISATLRNSNDTADITNNASWTKVREIRVDEALSAATIKFDIYGGAATTAHGQIRKNGSAIGTDQSQGNSSATKSEDFAALNAAAGDLIQLYIYAVNGGGGQQGIGNFRIYYSQQIVSICGKTLVTPLPISGAIATTNTL